MIWSKIYFFALAEICAMKGLQRELAQDLKTLLIRQKKALSQLQALNESELNKKPSAESWSALDCIEHLCRYGDFYLPECNAVLLSAKAKKAQYFKSSLLGEYFAKSMWPQQSTKTMNTFKNMNPSFSETRAEVLEEFSQQLKQWEDFIAKAEAYSWSKIKTSISISKLIKLRLGDTLRVVIYHQERHLKQAFKAAGLNWQA